MDLVPTARPLRTSAFAAAITATAFLSVTAHAQSLRGIVVDQGDVPVPGVVVMLVDSASATAARALTNERGEFRLTVHRPGRYRLRTLRIGFRPVTSEPVALGAGEEVERRVTLAGIPVALTGVRVAARSACRPMGSTAADSGAGIFAAWEQARAALTATQLTAGARAITATTVSFERTFDATGRRVVAQTADARTDIVTQPWRSIPPDSARRFGFITVDRDGSTTYYAPGLDVVLSDAFLEDHCFRLARARDAALVGIAFEPTPERRAVRGVARLRGTLWLDRASAELRRMDFGYVNASQAQEAHAGGDMEFARMTNGAWAISRWSIRMPALEYRVRSRGLGGTDTTVAGIRATGGELALALRGADTLWARPPLVLAGAVLDSASGNPVPGARVALAGTSLASVADGRGRFIVGGVLPGQYTLEVRTASLDSAGAAYPAPITVTDGAEQVEVRVPSGGQIVAAVCGRRRLDEPGIVVGTVVTRGDSLPLRGVRVVAEWTEASVRVEGANTVADRQSRWLEAKADDRGAFRLCGVPVNTALALRAEHDSGGTVDPAEVRIAPGARFARAELVVARSATRGAVLTGVVLVDSLARPVAEAEVSLPDLTKSAYTNDRGQFRLSEIPPGTHRVQVRRLGYGPLDTAIAFRPNQTIERRIYLMRVVALDSVTVIAEHNRIPSFEEHRRVGLGRFWTREELARQGGRVMSEVLSQTPGLGVARGFGNYAWVVSRRPPPSLQGTGVYTPEKHELLQGMKPGCYARVYIDGTLQNPDTPAEPFNINTIAATQIEAIEWYASPSQTPQRYSKLDHVCGVLVIWMRQGS